MCVLDDFEQIRPDAPPILALFKAMKRRGTILDATLLPFKQEAEHAPTKVGAGIMPWSHAVTRLAHEHGDLIDAGSDSSGLAVDCHVPDLHALPQAHAEMALLVEHAGFTPIEAIHAATEVSAAAMGQSAKRGTITVGKRADLVVLSADPTHDIHNASKITQVIKNGRIYRKNDG